MIDTSHCQLKDPVVSTRGAKSCSLYKDNGDRLVFQLGNKDSPSTTPFGMTSYNNETCSRKTVEFNLYPDQEKALQKFDEWAIAYIATNSERILKKKATLDQVRESYKSPVTRKRDYNAHLRCKINTSGSNMVRCWDEDNQRCELPSDLRTYKLVPRINISHLWMMSREFGWVLLISDMMISKTTEPCPFE